MDPITGHVQVVDTIEATNIAVAILALVLILILGDYLISEWNWRKLDWSDLFEGRIPIQLAFACALLVINIGFVVTRATVWYWQFVLREHSNPPLLIPIVSLSTFVTSIGMMWLIRILSKYRFGELIWLLTIIVAMICILLDITIKRFLI